MARHCSGVVLAGGGNTRFGGSPKGLREVGGRRVVDRVLAALEPVVDESLLITNDTSVRAALTGVVVTGDMRAERSSLIGLHSALSYCRDAALVVAWDMPFVSTRLLAQLREQGEAAGTAVIPTGPHGAEPLCAYYPRLVLEIVEGQLATGELRLSALLSALPSPMLLSLAQVSAFGRPARLFANINTEADLATAEELDRESVGAYRSHFTLAAEPERR